MFKVFLRIFLTTLTLILATFVFIDLFAYLVVGPPPILKHEGHFVLADLLRSQMETTDPSRLSKQAEALFGREGVSYRIVNRDDPDLPIELGEELLVRSELARWPKHFDTYLYLPFHGGRSVLIVGPVLTDGGPPSEKVPAIFMFVVVIVGFLAMVLSRPAWQNLRRFEKATQRLAEGDLTARAVNIRGPVSVLAERFNDMADALQEMFESQRHLLQAVSHELRTPVARIHFELEMMDIEKDEEKRHARVEAIVEHLQELNDLLDELLVFVRLEPDTPNEERQGFPIQATLDKLCADFSRTARDKSLNLSCDVDGSFELKADQRLFVRAVGNLVQNALRYAEHEVYLNCRLESERLVVSVEDDGPGIPPEFREKVFHPFSRIDESRNKKSGGVGLGLAITRRILTRHHGEIHIEDTASGQGIRFVSLWPVESAH
ncbi:Histidine kinase [Sulfidibacter corallicola]|uniref:histidine kinase n=1 Tax=Sulfidibacter corallicola TaxID=2818388 RepID=A0A8A4TD00_SULCO|nr:ATP-binding protein [Sulfidibacter corallicola]QTD47969.1 HAMP domain-containing protein [Sulfidibacter corallicola]